MDAWIREKLAGWTATCGLVIVIVMVVALWRHASFHRPLSFLLLLLVAVLIVIVANRVRRSIDLLTPPRHGVGYPSTEKPSYIKDSHSAPSGRSSPRSDSAASATRGAEASPLSARGAAVSSPGQGTDRPAAAHPTPPDNYATIDGAISHAQRSGFIVISFFDAGVPLPRRLDAVGAEILYMVFSHVAEVDKNAPITVTGGATQEEVTLSIAVLTSSADVLGKRRLGEIRALVDVLGGRVDTDVQAGTWTVTARVDRS